MRLLGAKNSFIRAPFIVEGILLGLIGAVIPIIIVYFAYDGAIRNLLSNSSFLSGIIELQGVGDILKLYVPVALILGIGIGLIGSMISLGKTFKSLMNIGDYMKSKKIKITAAVLAFCVLGTFGGKK